MSRIKKFFAAILVISFALLIALPAFAVPRLFFSERAHNFGEVEQNTANKYIFKFENKGDTAVDIVEAKPSCGCTVALMTSQTVQPCEKGELEVTFNSGKFKGKIKRTIDVKVRDSIPGVDPKLIDEEKYPTTTIKLILDSYVKYDNIRNAKLLQAREIAMKRSKERKEIIKGLEFTPKAITLGKVKVGTEHKRVIKFTTTTKKEFKIERVTLSVPYASAMIKKIEVLPGSAGEVQVDIVPQEPAELTSGKVSIYITGIKAPIVVPISWSAG